MSKFFATLLVTLKRLSV